MPSQKSQFNPAFLLHPCIYEHYTSLLLAAESPSPPRALVSRSTRHLRRASVKASKSIRSSPVALQLRAERKLLLRSARIKGRGGARDFVICEGDIRLCPTLAPAPPSSSLPPFSLFSRCCCCSYYCYYGAALANSIR